MTKTSLEDALQKRTMKTNMHVYTIQKHTLEARKEMPCNNIFAYEVTSSPKDMNHSGNERLICHHKSYTSNTTRKQEKKTALT